MKIKIFAANGRFTAVATKKGGFHYLPFFGKSDFSLQKKKVTLKFGSPSLKIGRSTAVLIFSGWPLKSG